MATIRRENEDSILAVFAQTNQGTIHVPHYLTLSQKKKILTSLGYACLVVLDHYFYKASVKSNDFSDLTVAEELGLKVRMIQIVRLKLVKNGWFYQTTYSHARATPLLVTALGQENVRAFNKNPKKALSKLMSEMFS